MRSQAPRCHCRRSSGRRPGFRQGVRDLDARVGTRVFGRVLEQVADGLVEVDGIDPHGREIGRDADLDAPADECRGQPRDDRFQQLVELEDLEVRAKRAALDPAQVEQVADEAVQPLGFGVDGARVFDRWSSGDQVIAGSSRLPAVASCRRFHKKRYFRPKSRRASQTT